VTPRRSLPDLRARDKMHDVFQGWRRFGSAFRRLANAQTQSDCYRAVQRQLEESQQKLQRAASEMDRMRIAVEQVRVRQMEVLAFVAHELRNPLAPIRTAAGILGRGRAEDIVAVRTTIERQVGQMSRLIDDLLDVSRSSTGKLRLVPAPVRIDDLVARAIEAVEPAMAGRGQKLDVIGLGNPVYLNADGTRLIQVLSNLLDNASKYSAKGQQIQLNVRCLEQSVELSVLDRGIGISIHAMKHIFDAFNQELHAVGFNATGLGIGLAVVCDVVEAHGGGVTAFSEGLGYGSRFVVTLPRSMAVAEQASS
jgi:signal transduction histidine kinase